MTTAEIMLEIRDTPNGIAVDSMYRYLYGKSAPDFVQMWYYRFKIAAIPTRPVLLENL